MHTRYWALGGGRQGGQAPKPKGLTPYPAVRGGWSAAWVRGYHGGGARGGLNRECGGPSPIELHVGRQMLEKSHL